MTYIYLLTYKYNLNEKSCGVLSFSRKRSAIETARYYRDRVHCACVTLRQDRLCTDGMCDIIGLIDF